MTPSPALASPAPVSQADSTTSHVPSSLSPPTSSAVTMPSFSVGGTSPLAHACSVVCAPATASPLRCIGLTNLPFGISAASLAPFGVPRSISGRKNPWVARCRIRGELTFRSSASVAFGPRYAWVCQPDFLARASSFADSFSVPGRLGREIPSKSRISTERSATVLVCAKRGPAATPSEIGIREYPHRCL